MWLTKNKREKKTNMLKGQRIKHSLERKISTEFELLSLSLTIHTNTKTKQAPSQTQTTAQHTAMTMTDAKTLPDSLLRKYACSHFSPFTLTHMLTYTKNKTKQKTDLLSANTQDLYNQYVIPFADLFIKKKELCDMEETQTEISRKIERLEHDLQTKQGLLNDRLGACMGKRAERATLDIMRDIQATEVEIEGQTIRLVEMMEALESYRNEIRDTERIHEVRLGVFFACPSLPRRLMQMQTPATPATATLFQSLMTGPDTAANIYEYMTTNEALTGVGFVSDEIRSQARAALLVLTLRYHPHMAVPRLDHFTRLRHLRIDDLRGGIRNTHLEVVLPRLESLFLTIKTPSVAKMIAAIPSLPRLRHLYLGTTSFVHLQNSGLATVGKLPLLESFAMYALDPEAYSAVLGPHSDSENVFPLLRSLTFPEDHVLLGGKPQYLRFMHVEPILSHNDVAEVLLRYPQTSSLEIDGSHTKHLITFIPGPLLK
jgi:hypothetical protein